MSHTYGSYQPARPPERKKVSWLPILLGSPVIAALIALVVAWAPWSHTGSTGPTTGSTGPTTGTVGSPLGVPGGFEPASLFVNRDSGPGGTEVRLSGEKFAPGERIVISFETEELTKITTDSQGKFANVTVTIPTSYSRWAPQQFQLIAHGLSSAKTAMTPFTITG